MSNKSNIIKEFNSILESFLGQLSPLIGTTYNFYFKKLTKVNSILPIQQFCNNVYPYKKKIMEEDESYFSDANNYSNDVDNMKNYFNTTQENTLDEILRLKDVYYKLDTNSKKAVWSIFKALVILSEDYLKLNH